MGRRAEANLAYGIDLGDPEDAPEEPRGLTIVSYGCAVTGENRGLALVVDESMVCSDEQFGLFRVDSEVDGRWIEMLRRAADELGVESKPGWMLLTYFG